MADQNVRLIVFRAGPEFFVLDIMSLRQIVAYEGSTPVPRAPEFIEGIIALRNEVIPVIDLRRRFFPQIEPPDGQSLVLVTRTRAGSIGLRVDEVRRMMTVELGAILPPPEIVRGIDGELFIGVVPQNEKLFLLIDLETLLTTEEQRSLAEARLDETELAS